MDYPELEPVLAVILQTVSAQKILLFGGGARCEAHPESDYDLLVVVVPPEHKAMEVWKGLYEATSSVKKGFSLDILLATREDVEKHQDAWNAINSKALKEGKVPFEGQG
ncbi:MAG: nucleotidyltransferase domain-containing protein [Thermus sp.]|uniref:nucleotidyltransferase domain-containing protein n=1 Tax=Thermus sp. TaxID=275 RepID=UPI003919F0C6